MKKLLYITFTLLLTLVANANIGMGNWRTHLAYNSVNQIAQSEIKIYAVSEGALFSVNKTDGDTELYSKMSGLNDTKIESISYDKFNNQLLIVYLNGNIDIMHDAGVSNIPDLLNKQMSTSKSINDVFFLGSMAYLSCDFGVMLLNMTKKEISDTYIIGPNATEVQVLSTIIHEGKIYALTPNTIFSADASNPNLVNYEFWDTETGLPGTGSLSKIISFAGEIVLLRGGKLYKKNADNSWSTLISSLSINDCNASNGRLIISDATSTVYILNENFELSVQSLVASPDIEYDDKKDTYWVAGQESGIISFELIPGSPAKISYYKPLGPAVNIPFDMTFAGEKLFMVNGGRFEVQYNRPGIIMTLKDDVWSAIFAADQIQPVTNVPALDFMNVAVDPDDDSHFYVTSYGSGLFEFKNNKFTDWYNHLNSTLYTIIPNNPYAYIRLDGAIFDKDKNLLLTNMGTGNAIKIRLNTGEWKQLYFADSSQPTLGKILISNQNSKQKWVPSIRRTAGILVWDDNGTLTDQVDDKSVFFSKFPDVDNEGSYLIPSYIYCLAQDKNGVIWAGSDMGPLLFYNPSRVFESNYTCSRVKIPRNDDTGLADYLLQNEKVRAIVIDGANRKWIGTETSGLYLMSENGQETIHHFTASNSPLLSDNIMSLAINPVSGEVFIGTSGGLISFQSDAAEAGKTFGEVYAYPNPVREDYTGIITITGLVENTEVKITDVNGNLIYQTLSNGSIATWDGKDVLGRKVSTGIYLAICVNEDGTQSSITKIMVIN